MSARRLLFLFTVALAAGTPSSAYAATTERPTAKAFASQSAGGLVSDGRRWVVFTRSPGELRVRDDASGERFDVPIPCATGFGEPVMAVGGGQAVIGCDYHSGRDIYGRRPLLLDLERRSWHQPAGVDAVLDGYTVGATGPATVWPTAVGAHWVEFVIAEYRSGRTVRVDWRTGEVGPAEPDATVADLDAPQLNVPLCPPILRRERHDRRVPIPEGPPFDALLFDAPYAVAYGLDTPLTVQRCGSPEATAISESVSGAFPARDVQFEAGAVSWRAAGRPRVHLVECGVLVSWGDRADRWAHTAAGLFRTIDGSVERWSRPQCATVRRPVRMRFSSGGATVVAQAISGRWPASNGGISTLSAAADTPLPEIVVAPRRALRLNLAMPARSVGWSAGGSWHSARGSDRDWRLSVPSRLGGPRTLVVAIDYRGGWRVDGRVRLRHR